MGGEVERAKLMDFSWELPVAEMKFELQSNIIPIGRIRKGTFYHRALLFKVVLSYIGQVNPDSALFNSSLNTEFSPITLTMQTWSK